MDVPTIRNRFLAALADGKSTEEATRYANDPRPMRVIGKVPPPPAELFSTTPVSDTDQSDLSQGAGLSPAQVAALDHDGDGEPGGSRPAMDRGDEQSRLRAEAEALGIKPDMRWGPARLKAAIKAASE